MQATFGGALRNAIGALLYGHAEIVLLGVAPEGPDPELGYIVPAGLGVSGQRVSHVGADTVDVNV